MRRPGVSQNTVLTEPSACVSKDEHLTPMNIGVSLAADLATLGELVLDRLAGQARVTAAVMTLEPIGFGVFGGRYDGALTFAPGAAPGFD